MMLWYQPKNTDKNLVTIMIAEVKSGSPKMFSSMVPRWLHELEPMNHFESRATPIIVPFSYEPKARERTL